MTDRISSYGQSSYTLKQLLSLEAKYSNIVTQTSSGLKSETFSGIASDSQKLLNLESQYNKITTQTTNATNVQYKINTASNSLSNISDVIATALSNVSSAISNTSSSTTTTSVTTQLQSDLDEIVSSLNTQYAGNYIFGGNMTNTAPVNLNNSGYSSLTSAIPNTTYYNGDNAIDSIVVSDSITIKYGITADNPAFEQVLRGLNLAIANPTDTTTLQQAYDLLTQASAGVINLSAATSANSNLLDNQITENTSALSYLDTNISDITSTDITELTVKMSNMKNQLDASYSALSNLLGLRLSDYLK